MAASGSNSRFSASVSRIAITFLTSPFGSFGSPRFRFFSLHLRDYRSLNRILR